LSKLAQLVFDTKQLVVLRNTVSTGRSTRLDLSSVRSNRDVSDCAVFGFAGTVGDNSCVTSTFSHFDSIEGFSQRTDLVNLDQDGVTDSFVDTFFKTLSVRYEQVITNELDLVAELLSKKLPTFQSSSEHPSSIVMIGYLSTQEASRSTNSAEV